MSAGRVLCIADDADRQRLEAAADLDLMPLQAFDIELRIAGDGVRDHQLAAIFLGQASRRLAVFTVVAHRRHRGGAAMAHLADDGGSGVDADADAQRLGRRRWQGSG